MKNPWINFQPSSQMVHPDDREIVDFHNLKSKTQHRFLLHLAPEPWIGNINAPIVILLANPGATNLDLSGKPQIKAEEIIAKSISNLHQDLKTYKHFFFDPALEGTQGQKWYLKSFKSLLKEFDIEHISNSILTCEMAPYHSKNWKKPNSNFPTQDYTNFLVREAIERGAVILMHRARKLWLEMVPELEKYPYKYMPSSWQSAAVSPNNYKQAYEAIRTRLVSNSL